MDIQWHTEARQQPRIIGKDSSGRRIPGGPYTIYQVLAVGGVVPAAMMGFKIIDGGMTIRGFIFALAAGWLAQFVVGRIDWTWSPLAWLAGWWRVTTHAATTPAGMTHTPLWGQTKLRLPTPPRPAPAIPPVWAASHHPQPPRRDDRRAGRDYRHPGHLPARPSPRRGHRYHPQTPPTFEI
ncbi:hypothetical protein JCM18916_3909 [Cutibacterium acnes JCM 18916]|nr:hypothetical protein JCM18916_3909 [Cutibacterium acnes JCM 18916]